MKTLLLCLALGISFSASAQKIRFTDTSNQWVYVKPNDCSNPIHFDYFRFHYDGDTVVNGITYQKLYETTPSSTFISPFLLGLIREDTTVRKVYIKYPAINIVQNTISDATEHILFDYTLSIGDTIKFDHYDTLSHATLQSRSVLTSIDSVTINGAWHIRQKFSTHSNYPWPNGYDVIEGIGGNHFNPIAPVFAAGECSAAVICFRHHGVLPPMNGIILQNNTSCLLGVQQVDIKSDQITVSPNPLTTSAKVSFPHTISKGTITMYSYMGQVIQSTKFNHQKELNIEALHHPPGLYYLEVHDEIKQRRYFAKLVVDK